MHLIHRLILLCGAAYCGFHMARIPLLLSLPPLLRWGIPLLAAGLLALVALPRLRVGTAFLIYLCGCYVLMDLLQLLLPRLSPAVSSFAAGWAALYRSELLPLLLAGALTLGCFLQARAIRTTEYSISLPGLQGEPVKLALMTDMHVGTTIRAQDIPKVMERMQALEADAILLGGDFIDESSRHLDIRALLDGLMTLEAPLGVYFVPGNHEYRAMRESNFDLPGALSALEQGGVTPLLDKAVPLGEQLTLVGRNDAGGTSLYGRKPLPVLLAEAGSEKPIILLDHRPEQLSEAAELGVSLHVAGHTHNGQLFPIGLVYNLFHKYEMMYGHRQQGAYHAIISSGIGTWGFAIRSMSRSEIVVITLSPT